MVEDTPERIGPFDVTVKFCDPNLPPRIDACKPYAWHDRTFAAYAEWSLRIDQKLKDILESAYDAGYVKAHYTHTGERGIEDPLTFEEWLAKTLEEANNDQNPSDTGS